MFNELEKRATRLAAGEFRSDDLTALFLGMRDFPRIPSSVREVAHFIAHRDREKGVTSDTVSDFFWMAIAHMEHMNGRRPRFHYNVPFWCLPACFAALRQLDTQTLRLRKIDRTRAMKVLSELEQVPTKNEDGSLYFPNGFSIEEARLINFLSGTLAVRSPFENTNLVTAFQFGLREMRLLPPEKIPKAKFLNDGIAAFTAASMHQRFIVLPSGQGAPLLTSLTAVSNSSSRERKNSKETSQRAKLEVYAQVPMPFPHQTLVMSFSIFSANVNLSNVWLGPLTAQPLEFHAPIEFENGQLKYL
jgi:hypothetical protein